MTNTQDIRFWNKIARKYAQDPIADPQAYEYTLARTLSYLSPQHKVLEIGGGTGSTALRIAPNVKEYHGTDLSNEMITIAQEKLIESSPSNIHFSTLDIDMTQKIDVPVDVILAFNLLHLVHDLDHAIAKISKALPTGGLFISKTVCMPPKSRRLGFWLITKIIPLARLIGKAPFAKIPEIKNLEQTILNHNFEIIECGNHPTHPPRRFIVAKKL